MGVYATQVCGYQTFGDDLGVFLRDAVTLEDSLDEDVGVFGCHVAFVGCLHLVGHGENLMSWWRLWCLFIFLFSQYSLPGSSNGVGLV